MEPDFDVAYMNATSPGEGWETYNGPEVETSGLEIILDYSEAGYSKVPMIVANLVGEADNWVMQLTVTEITESSAKAYIRSTLPGYSPTVTDAQNLKWHVVFYAVPPKAGYTLPPMTWYTVACDNA